MGGGATKSGRTIGYQHILTVKNSDVQRNGNYNPKWDKNYCTIKTQKKGQKPWKRKVKK